MKIKNLFIGFLLFPSLISNAQSDSFFIRNHIENLTHPSLKGRGYVGEGMEKAAHYIADEFSKLGVIPVEDSYFQTFEMPVVTFPSKMQVSLGKHRLEPGIEFLVDPSSQSININRQHIEHIYLYDLVQGLDSTSANKKWITLMSNFESTGKVYMLHQSEKFKSVMKWNGLRAMSSHLPVGTFIIPLESKPLWYPAQKFNKGSIVYLFGEAAKNAPYEKSITVNISSILEPKYKVSNVIGMIKGTTVTDSFIVFTAHYDHIGMMGQKTMFPGASDNASGTAMMLNLARYYAANPQKYNLLFIACSAEEAGLLGSKYYAENPYFPLKNIRFLINMDIFGDATNGVAVINGKVFEKEFKLVEKSNVEIGGGYQGFFKEIRKGEEATNSDHAPFYLKGVPAFFFFTMGGPGHYHNTFDKDYTLRLTNINQAAMLLKSFVTKLQN